MTPQEQQKYIQDLENHIAILEAYKLSIEREQVKFPLDAASQKIIHTDLLVPTGNVVIPFELVTYNESVKVDINGKRYSLVTTSAQ